jgi:hypothetical protein
MCVGLVLVEDTNKLTKKKPLVATSQQEEPRCWRIPQYPCACASGAWRIVSRCSKVTVPLGRCVARHQEIVLPMLDPALSTRV